MMINRILPNGPTGFGNATSAIDVFALSGSNLPIASAVKVRGGIERFATLERHLGANDALMMGLSPTEPAMSKATRTFARIRDYEPSAPTAFKIDAIPLIEPQFTGATDYLIKGVIEPSTVSIWFGPPGNAKTFLMLHLAHCIANGRPAFGRRVRQAATLYLALEGRGGIEKRVYALAKVMGASPHFLRSDSALQLLRAVPAGRPSVNKEHVEELARFIRDKQVKFVIVDTLNLTLGGADENDNSTMGQLIRAAGEIAVQTGAHIAFVAHSAKSGTDSGPRGGGAQLGNADLVVAVSGDGIIKASSCPPGGKIKDGAPFELHFKLNVVELGVDADGDQITSCTVQEAGPSGSATRRRLKPELEVAYRELCDLFSTPGASKKLVPMPGMSAVPCVKKAQVLQKWIETGRLDKDGQTPSALAKQAQRLRNILRDHGKIGMTREDVWLVDMVDNDGH